MRIEKKFAPMTISIDTPEDLAVLLRIAKAAKYLEREKQPRFGFHSHEKATTLEIEADEFIRELER